jgi:hypothetical protein
MWRSPRQGVMSGLVGRMGRFDKRINGLAPRASPFEKVTTPIVSKSSPCPG